MKTRIERDSLGELAVPETALYGAQTQRALDNFTIQPSPLPESFIRTLIMVKKIAAITNQQLKCIDNNIAKSITQACDQLLSDASLMQHFPVNIYQTGSGTSTNMNANEVIARLASKISNLSVNANDHVNYGQSSNDVIPSTIHISATLALTDHLLPALKHFINITRQKALSLRGEIKTGRTHLMDAMPVSMEQSVATWAEQIELIQQHIEVLLPSIQTLAQGGTAVGTGVNAHPQFANIFNKQLNKLLKKSFKSPHSFFTHIGSQDTVVGLSGQLKTLAVALIKISNDLRWMNSGPLTGLSEIELEGLQPGSSIMPGKVNPVIPEAVVMAATQAIGNDTTITLCGQSGNFELNVMLPLIATKILESIHLLSDSAISLADKAIASFTVNREKLRSDLQRNPILVTVLNPIIGYELAATIAKQAYQQKRPIIDIALENTELSREALEELLDPAKLVGSKM